MSLEVHSCPLNQNYTPYNEDCIHPIKSWGDIDWNKMGPIQQVWLKTREADGLKLDAIDPEIVKQAIDSGPSLATLLSYFSQGLPKSISEIPRSLHGESLETITRNIKTRMDELYQKAAEERSLSAIEKSRRWGWDSFLDNNPREGCLGVLPIPQREHRPHCKVEIDKVDPALPGERFNELVSEIHKRHPEAQFYEFTNKVGNWRDILVVDLQGKKYAVRKHGLDYLEGYLALKDAQNRPEIIQIPINGKEALYLTEFVGTDVIDFTNRDHVRMLGELMAAFASRKDMIDMNRGNLVVKDNKLYYVDQSLTYVPSKTVAEAKEKNLDAVSWREIRSDELMQVFRGAFEQRLSELHDEL